MQDIVKAKPQDPVVDTQPLKDVPPVEELPAWLNMCQVFLQKHTLKFN
jgi:hypothetical protein